MAGNGDILSGENGPVTVRDRTVRRVASGPHPDRPRSARRPDGSEAWVSGRGRVLRDGRGEAVRVIGTLQDVTTHKERERRLRESEERWRKLVEHNPVALFISRGGQIRYVNEAAAAMVGREAGGLVGQPLQAVIEIYDNTHSVAYEGDGRDRRRHHRVHFDAADADERVRDGVSHGT